jgi:putative Mg2+ transporter-C (MgtC) family protein
MYDTYVVRLTIALLVGGLIGLERELKGKPAGIRTNMLICVGSCLLMIISIEIATAAGGPADPARLAAQVVTGIGFIGAGTIIRSRFQVSGLTTAATIWVLAALGLGIGAGYLILAAIGTVLIVATLTLVRLVERVLTKRRSSHAVQLILEKKQGVIGAVLRAFKDANIVTDGLDIDRSTVNWTATFEYAVPRKTHLELIERLADIEGVGEVTEL